MYSNIITIMGQRYKYLSIRVANDQKKKRSESHNYYGTEGYYFFKYLMQKNKQT